jgi:AraC-like DNA-binding protein
VRIAKAREALEFSMRSINEIAWQVGYEDHGAFRKVFNRIVGLSPGQYRERFGIADSPLGSYVSNPAAKRRHGCCRRIATPRLVLVVEA